MEHQTYKREEIQSNINVLKTQEENLLLQRKELNRIIKEKRDQIKYWEELDSHQYKAF